MINCDTNDKQQKRVLKFTFPSGIQLELGMRTNPPSNLITNKPNFKKNLELKKCSHSCSYKYLPPEAEHKRKMSLYFFSSLK